MEKFKFDYPLVVTAAQGKCGKGYLAQMLKSTIQSSVFSETYNKNIYLEKGKSSHEWLVRPMSSPIIIGWSEPNSIVCNRFPIYKQFNFDTAYIKANEFWNSWSLPKLNEYLNKGMFVDSESRFAVISYYFIKRDIHPDNIRIIVSKRPLSSIAYQNCRVGGYSLIRPDMYYLGNLLLPWCRNNLTVPPKPIDEITQQELCMWYTIEMEERKKKLVEYFPNVAVMEWDMEVDSKSYESWDKLLYFLSCDKQKLVRSAWMDRIIDTGTILHQGPIKCNKFCPHKKVYCTEDTFKDILKHYKIVYNTENRREGLL